MLSLKQPNPDLFLFAVLVCSYLLKRLCARFLSVAVGDLWSFSYKSIGEIRPWWRSRVSPVFQFIPKVFGRVEPRTRKLFHLHEQLHRPWSLFWSQTHCHAGTCSHLFSSGSWGTPILSHKDVRCSCVLPASNSLDVCYVLLGFNCMSNSALRVC